MSNALAFYADAGLTTPKARLVATQATDGAAPPVDTVVYVGAPAAGKKFQAASDPGVDTILLSNADAAGAPQVPATALRLALSSGGLASATPGAALALGTQILSGPANAVAVHVRIDAPALAAGVCNNLALETVATVELPA